MKSTRYKEFWSLLILLVLTRVTDGYLTYKITPDLTRELNPLVSVFGLGWPGLIMVASLVIIPTVVLSYFSIFRPFNNFPQNKMTFKEFKEFYFSKSNPNLQTNGGKVIVQTLGYIVSRVFIIWGFWVILHNYLVLIDDSTYGWLRANYKIWIIGYLLPGILGVVLTTPFLKHEFRRYKQVTNQAI